MVGPPLLRVVCVDLTQVNDQACTASEKRTYVGCLAVLSQIWTWVTQHFRSRAQYVNKDAG